MTHLFYALISAMTVVELLKFSVADRLYKRVSKCQQLDRTDAARYMAAHPILYVVTAYDLFGLTVLCVGLASSQWFCFLAVILLSFSRFQRLGVWAVRLDCLPTAAIFLLAVINKYHLHLDWAQVITEIIK